MLRAVLKSSHPTPLLPAAVLDDAYRRALVVPAERLFPQLDLAQHSGVMDAVRCLLGRRPGRLEARLHCLNVYE